MPSGSCTAAKRLIDCPGSFFWSMGRSTIYHFRLTRLGGFPEQENKAVRQMKAKRSRAAFFIDLPALR
jgi:hypothetical protein